MHNLGPIVLIEDDEDDLDLFRDIFKDLDIKNEIVFFQDGGLALQYLIETKAEPFIIFSDIDMPRLSGMELRAKLHENEDLRMKSIPYLFFTTTAEQKHVIEAYSKSIQGFFIKPTNYDEFKEMIKSIIEYWQKCVSPIYVQ